MPIQLTVADKAPLQCDFVPLGRFYEQNVSHLRMDLFHQIREFMPGWVLTPQEVSERSETPSALLKGRLNRTLGVRFATHVQ